MSYYSFLFISFNSTFFAEIQEDLFQWMVGMTVWLAAVAVVFILNPLLLFYGSIKHLKIYKTNDTLALKLKKSCDGRENTLRTTKKTQ